MVHVSECEREKEGGKKGKGRQPHTARDDAKSANSATAGLSRQSPLQETQIKADLGSRDLLCAPPTGSLDPEAVLFPSVPRSVERDDKDLTLRRAAPPPKLRCSLAYSTHIRGSRPGDAAAARRGPRVDVFQRSECVR